MVDNRGNRGNCILVTESADYRRLFILTVLVAYLMTTCSCLSLPKERKPNQSGDSLLKTAISEMEDALSKLKQYAKSRAEEELIEEPQAESFERNSRDEDYRQEPELVPGLDRFEKNLDESNSGKNGASQAKSSDGISAEDLINLLRKNTRDKKNGAEEAEELEEFDRKEEAEKAEKKSYDSSSTGAVKDVSLNDLLDFLRERQNKEKQEGSTGRYLGGKTGENTEIRVKGNSKDGSSDVSLKEALEYVAILKKKLSEERARHSQ